MLSSIKKTSFYKMTTPCCCDDDTMVQNYACVICLFMQERVMSDTERALKCEQHKHTVFVCCGLPDFVCDNCKEDGWYSLKGTGGGDNCVNEITGEWRKPLRKRTAKYI